MTSSETLRTGAKPFRILIEQIELALKFNSSEDLESACNELLAHTKTDEFNLTWAENGKYEQFSSKYPVNVEVRLRKIPYDSKVVRLSRTCGHCGQIESIAHSSGHVNGTYGNVQLVLGQLQKIEEF